MNQTATIENGRVVRNAFPDIATINTVMGGNDEARVQRLVELYRSTQSTLDELKKTHTAVKGALGALIRDVREDVTQVFTDEEKKGFKASAKVISHSVMDLIKGSAGEMTKLKDEGADATFLLTRMVQYRNALLDQVRLRDPVGGQDERLGSAVLVYVDEEGHAFSCRAGSSDAVTDAVKQHAPLPVHEADVADEGDLLALVRQMVKGRKGVLDRRDVLFVDAPRGTGLSNRQILNKAAALYRSQCRVAKTPPPEAPPSPETTAQQGE